MQASLSLRRAFVEKHPNLVTATAFDMAQREDLWAHTLVESPPTKSFSRSLTP